MHHKGCNAIDNAKFTIALEIIYVQLEIIAIVFYQNSARRININETNPHLQKTCCATRINCLLRYQSKISLTILYERKLF